MYSLKWARVPVKFAVALENKNVFLCIWWICAWLSCLNGFHMKTRWYVLTNPWRSVAMTFKCTKTCISLWIYANPFHPSFAWAVMPHVYNIAIKTKSYAGRVDNPHIKKRQNTMTITSYTHARYLLKSDSELTHLRVCVPHFVTVVLQIKWMHFDFNNIQ